MTEENLPIVIAGSDFDLLDRDDEQQIIDDLRGIAVEKLVYKNARGEDELSYAGTKWAVRKMAEQGEAIRVDGHPETKLCPVDPEYIIVTVLAKRVKVDKDTSREIVLDSTVGSSRGWVKQKKTDGAIIADPHFFTKTVSKATRNVQQALMPVELKKAMIKELTNPTKPKAKEEKRENVALPAGAKSTSPPASPPNPVGNPTGKAAESAKSTDDAGAARQRLMAAFKLCIGDDVPKIRKLLKSWTGKEKTHDLDVATMQSLTSALYKVKDGSAKYDESCVVDTLTDAILIGVRVTRTVPAAKADDSENMF